jgi:hypothetical protein
VVPFTSVAVDENAPKLAELKADLVKALLKSIAAFVREPLKVIVLRDQVSRKAELRLVTPEPMVGRSTDCKDTQL